MHKARISLHTMAQDSNGSVRVAIANDPGGIGYISLGLVNDSIKAIRINGAAATREAVISRSYVLVRPFLFVVKGKPKGAAREFIEYVLGPDGQRLLEKNGLVRAVGTRHALPVHGGGG